MSAKNVRRVEAAGDFQDVLNESEVRITFGIAFGIKGTVQVAHLEVGELVGHRTKWVKVEPMLVERNKGGRADLLQQMADILTMEVTDD